MSISEWGGHYADIKGIICVVFNSKHSWVKYVDNVRPMMWAPELYPQGTGFIQDNIPIWGSSSRLRLQLKGKASSETAPGDGRFPELTTTRYPSDSSKETCRSRVDMR